MFCSAAFTQHISIDSLVSLLVLICPLNISFLFYESSLTFILFEMAFIDRCIHWYLAMYLSYFIRCIVEWAVPSMSIFLNICVWIFQVVCWFSLFVLKRHFSTNFCQVPRKIITTIVYIQRKKNEFDLIASEQMKERSDERCKTKANRSSVVERKI